MRGKTFFALMLGAAVAVSSGCGTRNPPSDQREFTLQGQIISMGADRKEASIKHGEIKGFMPAMTMPYKVREAKEFESLQPGDLIDATLVVVSNDAYLKDVRHVGHAPLEQAAADLPSPLAMGIPLLKEGEPIPDATFVDQDGKKRSMASYRGSALVITFMYTKCPLPTFCPLMDRNFATIQQRLKTDRALDVKLVSISFDPLTDTPPVLKKHAKELGANPKVWTFFTGTREDIDRFAARFGVVIARAPENERDITHNLRTAIVDRQGNLVKTYTGNEWTPDQVLTEIKTLVGVN